MKMKDNLIAW